MVLLIYAFFFHFQGRRSEGSKRLKDMFLGIKITQYIANQLNLDCMSQNEVLCLVKYWRHEQAGMNRTSSLQESEELLGIQQAARSVRCNIFNKRTENPPSLNSWKPEENQQPFTAEHPDPSVGGAEKHGVLMESPAQFMMGDSQSLLDMLTENYLKDSQIVRVMPHVLTPSSIMVNTDPNYGI